MYGFKIPDPDSKWGVDFVVPYDVSICIDIKWVSYNQSSIATIKQISNTRNRVAIGQDNRGKQRKYCRQGVIY